MAKYTQDELNRLIGHYNRTQNFEPKVFPAHQRKIIDSVSALFADEARLASRVARMSDADKLAFLVRQYIAEAANRGVAPSNDFLFAALKKYEEHVTDDLVARRAAGERDKAEAAAAKIRASAEKAALKEAEREEKRRQRAAERAEKAAQKAAGATMPA